MLLATVILLGLLVFKPNRSSSVPFLCVGFWFFRREYVNWRLVSLPCRPRWKASMLSVLSAEGAAPRAQPSTASYCVLAKSAHCSHLEICKHMDGEPADSRRLYSDAHYAQTMVQVLQSKPSRQQPRAARQPGRGRGRGRGALAALAVAPVPRLCLGCGRRSARGTTALEQPRRSRRAAFLGKAALKAGETPHRARLRPGSLQVLWTARWTDADLA